MNPTILKQGTVTLANTTRSPELQLPASKSATAPPRTVWGSHFPEMIIVMTGKTFSGM